MGIAVVDQRLGTVLALLRQRKGLSQKEAAERLCELSGVISVSRHELSRWEREVRIPSDFWLGWLSEVLEEPVSVLEEARARSKGGKTMAGSARSRTDRRTPTRPQSKRPLATVSLKFEHQATSVQLSGEYEEPEQAWAAVRMFERMVAPQVESAGGAGGASAAAPVEVDGAAALDAGSRPPSAPAAAANGSGPTRTPMGIRYTKESGC